MEQLRLADVRQLNLRLGDSTMTGAATDAVGWRSLCCLPSRATGAERGEVQSYLCPRATPSRRVMG